MSIEEFEKQVITALLAGDDPLLAALRDQYAVASVRDREMNTTGFVTRFDVPASAPAIDRKLLHLDDLQVEIDGAKTPADTSLHVMNGRLRSLECFVYEGTFPQSPSIRAAWYYGTEKYPGITEELLAERDLEEILEEE
jgi:hypothetical protein